MKVVTIEYAKISPAVLESIVLTAFDTGMCNWIDIDEDYFEFHVYGVSDLAALEDVLAEYM